MKLLIIGFTTKKSHNLFKKCAQLTNIIFINYLKFKLEISDNERKMSNDKIFYVHHKNIIFNILFRKIIKLLNYNYVFHFLISLSKLFLECETVK